MAGVCATVASQVPAVQKNPVLETATTEGAASTDSVCAILDSPARTAQRKPVPTTVMTVDDV